MADLQFLLPRGEGESPLWYVRSNYNNNTLGRECQGVIHASPIACWPGTKLVWAKYIQPKKLCCLVIFQKRIASTLRPQDRELSMVLFQVEHHGDLVTSPHALKISTILSPSPGPCSAGLVKVVASSWKFLPTRTATAQTLTGHAVSTVKITASALWAC